MRVLDRHHATVNWNKPTSPSMNLSRMPVWYHCCLHRQGLNILPTDPKHSINSIDWVLRPPHPLGLLGTGGSTHRPSGSVSFAWLRAPASDKAFTQSQLCNITNKVNYTTGSHVSALLQCVIVSPWLLSHCQPSLPTPAHYCTSPPLDRARILPSIPGQLAQSKSGTLFACLVQAVPRCSRSQS